MKAIVDLTIVPIGEGFSLSRYVAACKHVLANAGLTIQLHAHDTNIEGEWDDVFAAIMVGTRVDCEQSRDDKLQSVQAKLSEE